MQSAEPLPEYYLSCSYARCFDSFARKWLPADQVLCVLLSWQTSSKYPSLLVAGCETSHDWKSHMSFLLKAAEAMWLTHCLPSISHTVHGRVTLTPNMSCIGYTPQTDCGPLKQNDQCVWPTDIVLRLLGKFLQKVKNVLWYRKEIFLPSLHHWFPHVWVGACTQKIRFRTPPK